MSHEPLYEIRNLWIRRTVVVKKAPGLADFRNIIDPYEEVLGETKVGDQLTASPDTDRRRDSPCTQTKIGQMPGARNRL